MNTPASLTPESHPFSPWLPHNASLLMCGTFPPERKRWSMEFYYPNFINDMWRIFGIIYFGNKDAFVDIQEKSFHLPEIKNLLIEKGIALSDTGREAKRLMGNASDKFLEIIEPINLTSMLKELPLCKAIATTGEKAAGIIAELTHSKIPKMGEYVEFKGESVGRTGVIMRHYRMPSSSRAYPLKLILKAKKYGEMMVQLNMISESEFLHNLEKSGL